MEKHTKLKVKTPNEIQDNQIAKASDDPCLLSLRGARGIDVRSVWAT